MKLEISNLKICQNCGYVYLEEILNRKESSIEFDGYGHILCSRCRHNHSINSKFNTNLRNTKMR